MLLARQEELVQDASRRILGPWGKGPCCTLKYQVLLGPSLGPLSGPESRVHLSPQTLGPAEPTHAQHALGGGAQMRSPAALLGGTQPQCHNPQHGPLLSSPLQRGGSHCLCKSVPGKGFGWPCGGLRVKASRNGPWGRATPHGAWLPSPGLLGCGSPSGCSAIGPRAGARWGGSLVSCKLMSKCRTLFAEESEVFRRE